jgi:protein-tyrosine phosphatase
MAEVLAWQSATDPHAMTQQAVQAITNGQVVALPTDTGYCLAATGLCPQATDRFVQLRGQATDEPVIVAVSGPAAALEWAPALAPFGQRLARRCWPGPVVLIFSDGVADGAARQLPDAVRAVVCPDNTVALQAPAHAALLDVVDALSAPLLIAHTVRRGNATVPVGQVLDALGEDLGLVLDDGPLQSELAVSIVRVEADRWNMVREGAITAAHIQRLLGQVIVFVCTGNTCRSPMAEALFTKLLADRLGCAPADLPERGYHVLSAGVAATPGDEAALEAVQAVRTLGADLSGHVSRPLDAELAQEADWLLTMTSGHESSVRLRFGRYGAKPRLLGFEGEDIADPIGFPQDVYDECAREILSHLERLLPEIALP